MSSSPIPATPDLMAVLCVVGRVMRGEGPLGMRLLVIGALWPLFGDVLRTWLELEEHVATAPEGEDPWWGVERADDAVRSGWISRTGAVWRWRQMTRAGARVMLVRWFAAPGSPCRLRWLSVWGPRWRLAPPVGEIVFWGESGVGRSCALIVPVS